MSRDQLLFSTNETDRGALEILKIQDRLIKDKPDKLGLVKPMVVSVLEICLKAHRRNGCNTFQIKEIESYIIKAEDLLT